MSNHISIQPGDELREAMRFWASGVAVVGAEFEGTRHGMTVSSFTSLALEPPLVLVSLNKTSRTHDLVVGSEAFSVTILSEDQQDVSNRFAGLETEDEDRFAGLETYTLETGSPLLHDGLAFFDCKLVGQYDAGTNTVMSGEVAAAQINQHGDELAPLVYFNRNYRNIAGLRAPA
jgi:3-hydroxy-9,10-secoandrosta-1,3,5(10)-triene-9,17-dione monooxygenase reductase component